LIAAIVVSLLSVLVAAGAYFLYQEWRRYNERGGLHSE
jgi:hypothetical protein